jgi:hypothetical protein
LLRRDVTTASLHDLSTPASGYRVVSVPALGMLLLMRAFTHRRTRRLE